jgi:hypothetical protein
LEIEMVTSRSIAPLASEIEIVTSRKIALLASELRLGMGEAEGEGEGFVASLLRERASARDEPQRARSTLDIQLVETRARSTRHEGLGGDFLLCFLGEYVETTSCERDVGRTRQVVSWLRSG